MHSPVKPHPEVLLAAALAKHWLAPSRFENAAAHAQAMTHDGMRCLASLSGMTERSLPRAEAEAAAQPERAGASGALAAKPPATQPAAPALSNRFGSHREEYRSGLRDESVVQALLDFHTRTRVSGTRQAPLAGFSPEQVLEVAAQPKRPVAHRPGTTRVFRSR
jgi:hypothetical protein